MIRRKLSERLRWIECSDGSICAGPLPALPLLKAASAPAPVFASASACVSPLLRSLLSLFTSCVWVCSGCLSLRTYLYLFPCLSPRTLPVSV